jgi:hypothetical protein
MGLLGLIGLYRVARYIFKEPHHCDNWIPHKPKPYDPKRIADGWSVCCDIDGINGWKIILDVKPGYARLCQYEKIQTKNTIMINGIESNPLFYYRMNYTDPFKL